MPGRPSKPASPVPDKKSVAKDVAPQDPMEEEEKVLAGRPDVNLPALLTKDVQGG